MWQSPQPCHYDHTTVTTFKLPRQPWQRQRQGTTTREEDDDDDEGGQQQGLETRRAPGICKFFSLLFLLLYYFYYLQGILCDDNNDDEAWVTRVSFLFSFMFYYTNYLQVNMRKDDGKRPNEDGNDNEDDH